MINRSTRIFAGIVGVVVAYAVYDYKSEKIELEKKAEKSVLLNLKVDQIQQISISNSTGEFQLQRDKVGWSLVKPLQDATNESAVSEFLEGLATEKSNDVAVEGGKIDLTAFGLDHPKGFISVQDNVGTQVRFVVGASKNFQGDAFVRINEDPKVFVASSTWFGKIEKTANDFRDRRWMRMPAAGVEKLEFQRNTDKKPEKFQLVKRNDQWESPEHLSWKLDQNKVREILGMLNSTEGLEVIAEPQKPANKEELKKWGFQQPRMQLKVFRKQGTDQLKTWEGRIAAGGDKIHRVQVDPPAMIYKISPTDSDKFANASLDSFRDRGEPFLFDKAKVKKISWSLLAKSYEVVEENGVWKSSQGEVDQERIKGLLQKLSSLSAAQFVDGKAGVLDKEISLQEADGKELIRIRWGTLRQVVVPTNVKTSVFMAQTSAYSRVVSILESDINNFRLDDIFKKAEVKK